MFSSFAKFSLFAAAISSGTTVMGMTQQIRPPRVESADVPNRKGAAETTPSLQWRGIERVAILCQVSSEVVVGNDVVAKTLCEHVRTIAQRGAPVPVDIIGYSDPALNSPRVIVLFVQASVAEVAPSRLGLILTARTERNGMSEETRTYFGATPRVAPFTTVADGAAWDGAIAASLSEVLPWLRPAESGDLLPKK